MLLPDSRTVAFELIRPPSGYRLDFAVLTTFTLDLEALLVLPLSLLAHPNGGLEELLADPLRLHQAIQEAGDSLHAFVDETGIAIPRGARPLYSMLESSVHAVRAPNGGSFHPKVWVARFTANAEDADPQERIPHARHIAVRQSHGPRGGRRAPGWPARENVRGGARLRRYLVRGFGEPDLRGVRR